MTEPIRIPRCSPVARRQCCRSSTPLCPVSTVPVRGDSLAERTYLDPSNASTRPSDASAGSWGIGTDSTVRRALPRAIPSNRNLFIELCRPDAPSVAAAFTLGALVSLLPVSWSESGAYSLRVVRIAWPPTLASTLYVRVWLRVIAERAQSSRVTRVLIVGSGPLAVRLYDRMPDDPTVGYEVHRGSGVFEKRGNTHARFDVEMKPW